ncbi:hypothetical protein C8N40_103255 [Pontibacter mucosus]|uniref:Uncharacterized protein n=1 Tax=Pontibacter mucosus TaxID=1649266 RepID=A0A2T5YLH7_9BACT|nr:hypothetical protein C8N40_103255 [Pontibacter mucosus]
MIPSLTGTRKKGYGSENFCIKKAGFSAGFFFKLGSLNFLR